MNTDWREHIVSDPNIIRGKARIKGTRIPVAMILGFLAEGCTYEQVIEQFPDLTHEQIAACLGYARELAQAETAAGV